MHQHEATKLTCLAQIHASHPFLPKINLLFFSGLENVCLDIEFMLGIKTSVYWRFCWGLITPFMMIAVFIYALQSFDALVFGEDYVYPTAGYGMLIFISAFTVGTLKFSLF